MTKKLIIAYILILVIPIIFMSNSLVKRYEEENRNRLQEQLNKEVKYIEDDIQAKMALMKKIAFSISLNNGLLDRVGADKTFEYEEIFLIDDVYAKNLEVLLNSNPQLFAVRIFNDNPNMHEYWPSIMSENRIKNETLMTDIEKNNEIWRVIEKQEYLEMYENVANNYESVSFFKNIKKIHHDYNIIVEVGMLKEIFFESLNQSPFNLDSFYYVIKDNQILDQSDNGNFIHEEKMLQFEEWLVNRSTEDGGVYHYSDEIIIGKISIPELDMIIYKGLSLEGISTVLQKDRNGIVLTGLIMFFTLTAVTYIITYVLFMRLRKVIYSVENMDKSQPEKFKVIKGSDEISHLSLKIKEMLVEIDQLNKEALYEQQLALNAELKALQTQINSHFIYNTLETFKMMAEIDENYELSDLITNFGDLLRYSMKWNEKKTVTLSQELVYIQKYIALLNVRFDYEINLMIHVNEELLEVEIPKMSIQPIVENSFIHGIEAKCEDSNIIIDAVEDLGCDAICITITDDGIGMHKNQLKSINRALRGIDIDHDETTEMGIGIKNISDRIKLFYGIDYGITYESVQNKFTKAIIKVPKVGNKQ
ncbi:sensor histidine kinase [Vallitalea okinawensis]|uniref:sensor histidine kinase n=1 Tax=Vallitalea okinawensis TaxID=2078660 RepID=UPI0013004ECD|nr:histidine kinase [Vallitalea okinawensis]